VGTDKMAQYDNYSLDRTYVVLNENTLGVIHKEQPNVLDVLAGSVLKGGHDPKNGIVYFSYGIDDVRLATIEDFDEYRVSYVGHLT
jgi:hypothetical protein